MVEIGALVVTALLFLSPVWSLSTPPPLLPPPLAFNAAPLSIAAAAAVPGESSTPPSPLPPHLAFNAGETSPHQRPLPRPPSLRVVVAPPPPFPPPSIQYKRDVPSTPINAVFTVPFAGRAAVTTTAVGLSLPPSCCCKAACATATTVPSRRRSASAPATKLPPLPPLPPPTPHAAATCHCRLAAATLLPPPPHAAATSHCRLAAATTPCNLAIKTQEAQSTCHNQLWEYWRLSLC